MDEVQQSLQSKITPMPVAVAFCELFYAIGIDTCAAGMRPAVRWVRVFRVMQHGANRN